jgi:uncharacterized protein
VLGYRRVTSLGPSNNIAITGASGLVGQALCERWGKAGVKLLKLVRREPRDPSEVRWDPSSGEVERAPLEGLDAVVHLAGAGVADQRWTPAYKVQIRDSRVQSTRALVNTLSRLEAPPKVLVSASGVGYYGDGSDTWLSESSPPGDSFLANVCREWEHEAQQAEPRIRTVQLRIGMVLSPQGGALRKMRTPFALGLGGRLGDGRQFVSWLSLNDLLRIIEHCVTHPEMRGAVNAVGPNPVSNAEFTRALARALNRPALLPVPKMALRAVLGELADEVLAGQRAKPNALLNTGFIFENPELSTTLAGLLHVAATAPAAEHSAD